MTILRRIPRRPLRYPAPVAAIGIFDGVHRGHQMILGRAVARARAIRGTPMALTFYPHPLAVLGPSFLPPLLLSLSQRLKAFEGLGIRAAVVIPFTRAFSRVGPQDFIEKILVGRLRVREAVVGHDFGFGHGRAGTVATLRRMGRKFGFKVHVIPPVVRLGERVASHRIRDLIARGRLEQAAELLGRPVSIEGQVIRGAARGRQLGFPTANLKVEAGVLPPRGVYAVWAKVGGRRYGGMANLGFRPTFDSRWSPPSATTEGGNDTQRGRVDLAPFLLEAHLFGLRGTLYGRRLEIFFLKRLRLERRFPSAQALAGQLSRDASRAKALLARGHNKVIVSPE